MIKSSGKCNPKRKTYLSPSISGTVKVGRNSFYKYEYEYKICLPYMTQTPFSDTCLRFMVIFRKIVMLFFGRNTPTNKFLVVTNKETNKVIWHPY